MAEPAQAFAEIIRELTRTHESERVFQLVARHAAALLGAIASRVFTRNGDDLVLRGSYGPLAAPLGANIPAREAFAGEAIEQARPIRTENLAAGVGRWPLALAMLPRGCTNAVAAPLFSAGTVIGSLAVYGSTAREFDEGDEALLLALGDYAIIAIENARLLESERRQRAREQMLAAALATLDQPVLVACPEGRIVYANEATAKEYGYPAEALPGLPVRELAARGEGGDRSAEIAAALAERGVWTGEERQRRHDGSEFPAAILTSLIPEENGRPVGRVIALRNVAEERRLADQLRQTEKLVALGELVAGVAHEVNNPLTGISAFAQLLLEEGTLAEDQAESVRLIKKEADRAGRVIRDLLAFARKTGPRRGPVNLNAVVEESLRLRAYGLRAAGIEIEERLDPGLPSVTGDDAKLQQVVLNLLLNAEHALQNAPERRLRLRTCHRDGTIVLEVADTGVGMAPEVRQRIFEPFFTTKPEGTGTGLGLSVSYGIVQAHGGRLDVRSAPGAGSTFRLALPASSSGPSPSSVSPP